MTWQKYMPKELPQERTLYYLHLKVSIVGPESLFYPRRSVIFSYYLSIIACLFSKSNHGVMAKIEMVVGI